MISQLTKAAMIGLIGVAVNAQATSSVVIVHRPEIETHCVDCYCPNHTCSVHHIYTDETVYREESDDLATRIAAGILTGTVLLGSCWLLGVPVDAGFLRCAVILSMFSGRDTRHHHHYHHHVVVVP